MQERELALHEGYGCLDAPHFLLTHCLFEPSQELVLCRAHLEPRVRQELAKGREVQRDRLLVADGQEGGPRRRAVLRVAVQPHRPYKVQQPCVHLLCMALAF